MSVFSRASDIIQSNLNAMLDKAENPQKVNPPTDKRNGGGGYRGAAVVGHHDQSEKSINPGAELAHSNHGKVAAKSRYGTGSAA